eukprot:2567721-Pyramimonas_sp.AAC.1
MRPVRTLRPSASVDLSQSNASDGGDAEPNHPRQTDAYSLYHVIWNRLYHPSRTLVHPLNIFTLRAVSNYVF